MKKLVSVLVVMLALVSVSLAVPQQFQGYCQTSPAASASGSLVGLGQYPGWNCSTSWYTDAVGAARSAASSQLVVGAGYLGNLNVWTSPGTVITAGVVVKVWVYHAGVLKDTGLTCTVVGRDYSRCKSFKTFYVYDGDLVVTTFTVPAGDRFVGLNVWFNK